MNEPMYIRRIFSAPPSLAAMLDGPQLMSPPLLTSGLHSFLTDEPPDLLRDLRGTQVERRPVPDVWMSGLMESERESARSFSRGGRHGPAHTHTGSPNTSDRWMDYLSSREVGRGDAEQLQKLTMCET